MSFNHIPTGEILKDISDTEAEISVMEKEMRGYRIIGDRLSVMKALAGRGEQ